MSELIVIRLREVEQLNPLLRRIAKEAADALEAQAKRIAELEAKIDALMLEYCPDEMTPEQIENWGKHQRRVSPERTAEIDRAIALQEEA